jgi:leader peptidase (prepilin peptidase) / N-methyltransferase
VVIYFYLISSALGHVIGSFLNVVIYRVPRHESLVRPGSHCPSCGVAIRWYHNLPLVSWLALRGHCHDCGARISPRYPLVEGITAIAFALAFARFGVAWPLLLAWFFIAVMVAVAFIDYDHMIIPTRIVLPAALVGLLAAIALDPQKWWLYLAGAAGAAGFLFVLALVWPGAMGGGDIRMALLMGAVLGKYVLVAMFLAFLLGGIAGLFLLATKKRGRKDRVPFGPYLAVGSVLTVLAGHVMLTGYLNLYH